MHRIIYTHGGGRMGNQLLRFIHWIAWVAENPDISVLNLSFWPYARFFATWSDQPACRYPLRPSGLDHVAGTIGSLPAMLRDPVEKNVRLQRLSNYLSGAMPGWKHMSLDPGGRESIDLSDPKFVADIRSRPVTVCSGWRFAAWPLVARHQAAIRPLFAPAPAHAAEADDFLAKVRGQSDVVAGMLIRQTDYRTWCDGRFFHPARQYAAWMRRVEELHPGRRVAFVVASDEPQAPADFSGLSCHFTTGSAGQGGHWFESFAALARCDFILSVPSTFAAGAAFVGEIPLWPLDGPPADLSLAQQMSDPLMEASTHLVFSEAVK